MTVHIIAETCSNIISHLHDLPSIVNRVKATGATSLKVQLFQAAHFPEAEQAPKRLIEFPRSRFAELVSMCHDVGLQCGASVFDIPAVDLVVDSGGDYLKLATREWDNLRLVSYAINQELPVIRSYDCAVDVVDGDDNFRGNYTPMACVPQYPATQFKMPKSLEGQGWSSHTEGDWHDCLVAVARGATHIEKHIAFNSENSFDPEYHWSLPTFLFETMVDEIRMMESIL